MQSIWIVDFFILISDLSKRLLFDQYGLVFIQSMWKAWIICLPPSITPYLLVSLTRLNEVVRAAGSLINN